MLRLQVFACGGHAELERYKGKWLCLQSAAQAVANGAGLAQPDPDELVIESTPELEERLPAIAAATERDRMFFAAGEGEGWLYTTAQDRVREQGIELRDPRLLADALGIARFIEREVHPRLDDDPEFADGLGMLFTRAPTRPTQRRPSVVAGLLGELLSEAPR